MNTTDFNVSRELLSYEENSEKTNVSPVDISEKLPPLGSKHAN